MTTKEKIAVMEHYDCGGKIEIRLESGNNFGEWEIREKIKDGELSWCWSRYYPTENYRIYEEPKPKETVTIEKWLVIWNNVRMVIDVENIEGFLIEFGDKKIKLLDTYEVEL